MSETLSTPDPSGIPAPPRRLRVLSDWCKKHLPGRSFVLIVAVVTGLLTGFGAFLLKWIIGHITDWLTAGLHQSGPNWLLLVLPVVGLLLTVAFMRGVIHRNISHGIDQVAKIIKGGNYYLEPQLTFTPILASSMTLGFGGSAGAEGPIATVGAAIGSNMGRIMGVNRDDMMVMIGCGAGAGIAAIFKAPMGGMLFTLEVLQLPLTTMNVLSLLVASIVSSLTCYSFTGFTFDVDFVQSIQLGPQLYGYVILLGLFCGLYSIYYSKIMAVMGRLLGGIKSRWTRALLAGSVTGLLLFLLPALYGEGYGVVTKVVNGDFKAVLAHSLWFENYPAPTLLLLVTAGIILVKAFGTASATWGGVAGDFAPALYAGCMTGYVFAAGFNMLFGFELPVADFALVGMAAVMAGVIRAPLMAIFLTAEMTGNFHLFMPIVIAATVSYLVVAAERRYLTK